MDYRGNCHPVWLLMGPNLPLLFKADEICRLLIRSWSLRQNQRGLVNDKYCLTNLLSLLDETISKKGRAIRLKYAAWIHRPPPQLTGGCHCSNWDLCVTLGRGMDYVLSSWPQIALGDIWSAALSSTCLYWCSPAFGLVHKPSGTKIYSSAMYTLRIQKSQVTPGMNHYR